MSHYQIHCYYAARLQLCPCSYYSPLNNYYVCFCIMSSGKDAQWNDALQHITWQAHALPSDMTQRVTWSLFLFIFYSIWVPTCITNLSNRVLDVGFFTQLKKVNMYAGLKTSHNLIRRWQLRCLFLKSPSNATDDMGDYLNV